MAYLKPNYFTRRIFNPIAMRFGIAGVSTLAVPRRKSGGTQRVPVIAVEHEGARYLVSPRGETDWVKNLRAGGRGELVNKAGVQPFRGIEVPVEEREPILATYRRIAGKAVKAYFEQLPDPADHPVFRIEVAPS